ncbi:histidine phosphatase family protein [Variovorax terrae]|uniref:Histidine phosphatase family protein n=1 Tax=Variovorax terrae TaxID=2923278 RepID=A0A9X2ANK5_9BURK|nr:histidine phosphatase family protein [Variovorax terrae]MCJ0764943.1 histidine phosphatase family protein [Variovorax terrae]
MRLWLIRHARPQVDSGVCYGRLDLPADAAATSQAAHALADALPAGLAVITSPLQRCRQLADALLARRPDLGARSDARLAEMDFGAWEGRAWDAIPRAELDAWTGQFAQYRAGGTGESVHQFMERVAAALEEARSGAQDRAWITHAGVIKAVGLLNQGRAGRELEARDWPAQGLAWGQWQPLQVAPQTPPRRR